MGCRWGFGWGGKGDGGDGFSGEVVEGVFFEHLGFEGLGGEGLRFGKGTVVGERGGVVSVCLFKLLQRGMISG